MFRNGRLFQRQVNSIPKVLNSSFEAGRKKEQTDICSLIPARINRSPTDILKALSCTVNRDPTAFDYQIPDDPFFYPHTHFQKKKRILAMESGRKSARWIIENNPGFFSHKLAEPPIKAFLNKTIVDENSEINEESLVGLIQERNVPQAIAVYNMLQNKGTNVSKDVKLSLLELVCFYNSNEKPDENDLGGKWFEVDRKKKNVWKDDGFVKSLFNSLEPDCPLAYAALIQGMLKWNNLEDAMELFAAGKEKKIKFPLGVYNLIIENIPKLEKDPFKRFSAIESYLMEMGKESVKPNLDTLNSVLSALSAVDGIPLPKKESFVCELLVEFENLNIQPSLGTYYYLLKIFVDQNERPEIRMSVAWNIMDSLMKKRWTLQHSSDFSFLHFAMSLFCTDLRSSKLPRVVMKFYSEHDHYKFLNTNFAESQFFDQYISSVFKFEPVEQSMEVYRDLVPSRIFLDSRRYMVIVKAINYHKKFEYLEEIWQDMKTYLSPQFSRMYAPIGLILKSVSHFTKEKTPQFFYEAAEVLFKFLETAELEDKTLENMLIIFTRFDDVDKVLVLMDFMLDKQIFFIESKPLEETFDFALSKKNIPIIKKCLELSHRKNDPELKAMANKALPLLNEADQTWLNSILEEQKKKLSADEPKTEPQNK